MSLAARSTADERMDTDCVDFDDYRRLPARPVARQRCHADASADAALAGARRRPGLRSFSLLDVACGHGDVLRRIHRWAERHGIAVQLDGIDLNPWATRAAREATQSAPITYRTGDVFAIDAGRSRSTSSSARSSPTI